MRRQCLLYNLKRTLQVEEKDNVLGHHRLREQGDASVVSHFNYTEKKTNIERLHDPPKKSLLFGHYF